MNCSTLNADYYIEYFSFQRDTQETEINTPALTRTTHSSIMKHPHQENMQRCYKRCDRNYPVTIKQMIQDRANERNIVYDLKWQV